MDIDFFRSSFSPLDCPVALTHKHEAVAVYHLYHRFVVHSRRDCSASVNIKIIYDSMTL